jgi:hypothetical protein
MSPPSSSGEGKSVQGRVGSIESGLRIPARSRKELKRLLGQQFWLFGRDIRRPEGNLLAALGFEKRKAPIAGTKVPSRYTWRGEHAPTVVLWGFGMLWSDEVLGDVFLSRHSFAPLYRAPGLALPDAWDPGGIDGLMRPVGDLDVRRCQQLVLDAMAWLGAYERFVVAEGGHAYRDEAILAWKWPCGCAASLSGEWIRVRKDLATRFALPDTRPLIPVTGQIPSPGRLSLSSQTL